MESQLNEISEKLSILIKLSAMTSLKEIKLQKDKIILLSSFGLKYPEIALVLGCTQATIRSALSKASIK